MVIFPEVFFKKGVLKYLAKLTGKHVYRRVFSKKNFQYEGLQLYLKKSSCIGFFFLWNFLIPSEQLLYSTPINRCPWFNWILVNFDHHLRFTAMPENFDHHNWFYRKYLKFRRSYVTIWKPYLEHDIAQNFVSLKSIYVTKSYWLCICKYIQFETVW